MNVLINIALFIGIAAVIFSKLKIGFKRIIAGFLLYTMYVNDVGFEKLKGIFGFSNRTLDIVITQIIFAPLAIVLLGSILIAVLGSLNKP